MSNIDRLLSGLKWRCKICMHTERVVKGENMGTNIPIMENHVKRHRAVMTGYKDTQTQNMNWTKYIEPVGMENSING